MVKEPEEYTQVGQELRRLDQNIEGLIAKFERQSQMLVQLDQHEEHFERLISRVHKLEERIEKLEKATN
jgi:C4-type Zn-finger protein